MDAVSAFDLGTLYFFGSLHRDWLDPIMLGLTELGGVVGLGCISAAFVLLFVWLRQRRFAIGFAILALVAVSLNYGVKIAVGRPRPDVAWRLGKLPNNPSFPSGHALCSIAIYTTALTLLGSLYRRPWLGWLGVLLGLAIGLTRPYLGVHYPFDVLMGWIAGLGLALIAIPLILRDEKTAPGQSPLQA